MRDMLTNFFAKARALCTWHNTKALLLQGLYYGLILAVLVHWGSIIWFDVPLAWLLDMAAILPMMYIYGMGWADGTIPKRQPHDVARALTVLLWPVAFILAWWDNRHPAPKGATKDYDDSAHLVVAFRPRAEGRRVFLHTYLTTQEPGAKLESVLLSNEGQELLELWLEDTHLEALEQAKAWRIMRESMAAEAEGKTGGAS